MDGKNRGKIAEGYPDCHRNLIDWSLGPDHPSKKVCQSVCNFLRYSVLTHAHAYRYKNFGVINRSLLLAAGN